MAKKVTKRPRGRPVTTGVRPYLGARFSKKTIDAVDKYAKRHNVSRGEAFRRLIEKALEGED
jgi:hypothetical protein